MNKEKLREYMECIQVFQRVWILRENMASAAQYVKDFPHLYDLLHSQSNQIDEQLRKIAGRSEQLRKELLNEKPV